MELVVNKLYNIQSYSNINVESVAEDLVLVSLELKLDSYKFDLSPLHCLYYFGDFPPLDISFELVTGFLKKIKFFVDKSNLKRENITGNVEYQNVIGYPCFNTEFVEKNEYYYSETCEITVTLRELSLNAVRTNRTSSKKVIVNDNLSILLDEKETVVGVEINNLSNAYLDVLK